MTSQKRRRGWHTPNTPASSGRNLKELAQLCESLAGFNSEPIAYFYRAFLAAEVGRHVVLAQSCPHGGSQRSDLRRPAEGFQHHRRRKDGDQSGSESLFRDIRGRGL